MMKNSLEAIKEYFSKNQQDLNLISDHCKKFLLQNLTKEELTKESEMALSQIFILRSIEEALISNFKSIDKSKLASFSCKDLFENEIVQLEIKTQLISTQYENTDFKNSTSTAILSELCNMCHQDFLKIFSKIQTLFEENKINFYNKNIFELYTNLTSNLKFSSNLTEKELDNLIDQYFTS